MASSRPSRNADASALAQAQRAIQRRQKTKDRSAPAKKSNQAVQAGARVQPSRQTGEQQKKPGREADMKLRPRYTAPGYQGSGKLAGMSAIVTGGDSGIGRAVECCSRARAPTSRSST